MMQASSTISSLARGSIVLMAASAAWAGPLQGSSGSTAQDPQQVIEDWPDASKKAARNMLEQYGQPDGVTDSRLVWLDNGPWVRTIVYEQPVDHNFPMPHKDVLEQYINYEVPADKFTELARFDGSVVAYRTNGELAVRCDKEAANILALNLANDIIEGNRTVEEARAEYARTMQQVMNGEQPDIVRSLQFETQMASATADPGEQYELETTQIAASDEATSDTSSSMQAEGSAEAQARSRAADDATEIAASEVVKGMVVLSARGEEVGEVMDVMDKSGDEIVRIKLDEGFAGIGEQELTVPVSELTLTPEGQLQTRLTRDELKAMAEPENVIGAQGDDYELETSQDAGPGEGTSDTSSSMQAQGSADAEETELAPSAVATGMVVVSTEGEEVGEITEVMDKAGEEIVRIRLDEEFIGVGDQGRQELTLPLSEVTLTPDGQVRTTLTRDELRSMAEPENVIGGQADDYEGEYRQ